jgi:iron(III) transport system permease protein
MSTAALVHRRPPRHREVRSRWAGYSGWLIASGVVALLVVLPVVALAVIAFGGGIDVSGRILANLWQSAPTTAALLAGVGVLVVVIGTGTAWLVAAFDFPGRRVLDWALLLPLAVPTYVVAFAYLDLLHPIGPVQTAIRELVGITDPRDLQLPDIRSVPGAILLFGLVLYPYVYLVTRALFLMQAAGLIETARTLGANGRRVFFRIAIPLARPAIAIGVSLALMETLNDVGASEFLGIRTMTISVYATWVNQSDLAGAAEIALVMLAIVLALVYVERTARRSQRYAISTQRTQAPSRTILAGSRAWLALGLGALPVLLGFVVPAAYLAQQAIDRIAFAGTSARLMTETLNTVTVAAIATVVAVALGLVVAYAARLDRGRTGALLVRLASVGYALPGTVLAIGLLFPLAAFDNAVDDLTRTAFGFSTGLLLSGSLAVLVYAYAARFLAIATGGIEAGFAKIPASLDHSARSLGRTAGGVLRGVHLPLLRPALGATAILVFVDCMKELPATLLLRPLNFETLATHLYGEAARGTYEEGAIAALLIVAAGLAPVALLARLSQPAADSGRQTP